MTRKRRQVFLLLAVLALFSPVAYAQQSPMTAPLEGIERSALNPPRDMLDHGQSVATSACASCHGIDGVSTGPGIPNLAGQRSVYLYRVLLNYKSRDRHSDAMNHEVGFLSEEALLTVSAYYASLAPARPANPAGNGAAAASVEGGDPFAGIREDLAKCARCHGEDGNATASGMPNLSAQSPDYFVTSMQAYAEGDRNHKLMGNLAKGLDEATLSRMGVFYGVQEPARTTTSGDGNADLGRELAEPCAACHGADGNASGADMPTLAGQDARYFIKAMAAYRDGSRQHEGMFGAVDGLDDAAVADLAAFYAVQDPVRRNVRAPLTTAQWIDRCERCHGIDGNSTDPRYPMLAGQEPEYLTKALQSYVGETRGSSTMHAMSAPLEAADVERIVAYYSTREPKSVVYMVMPCEEPTDD
jgi:cytochrome c553